MMSDLLLVAGVAVLGIAMRSVNHPVSFRVGSWVVVFASFLAGWLIAGSVIIGVLLALSWFFLPWVEILLRVRNVRLPIDRAWESRTPPSRNSFPLLDELTEEIEGEGFEHVSDIGWEDDEVRQFYRIFRDRAATTQACICVAEQGDLTFYYLTLTSRIAGGRAFHSWNYPFPYGLKFSPMMKLNRIAPGTSFLEMLGQHQEFLRAEGIADGALEVVENDHIVPSMQQDLRIHIRHNIDVGFLAKDGEDFIRYTFRGMVFLWLQFLRDTVKLF